LKPENVKKFIISILGKYPEDLTVMDISKIVKMNRSTVSKYVRELHKKDKIYQINVGNAKLCYLEKRNF